MVGFRMANGTRPTKVTEFKFQRWMQTATKGNDDFTEEKAAKMWPRDEG